MAAGSVSLVPVLRDARTAVKLAQTAQTCLRVRAPQDEVD
jgi:hypothetical protein